MRRISAGNGLFTPTEPRWNWEMVVQHGIFAGGRTRHLVYQSAGEGAERITVACEYSDGQILPIGEQTPKLYIDFPLIGAEQFPFPTVINCRALCPNEPRSGISLVDNPNSHDALRNKELMKQAVVLYGQFLHNLVEQDFGSLQNAVAMPVCPENKEWSAQWVRARLYNGCLGCMKREPISRPGLENAPCGGKTLPDPGAE